MIRIKSDKIIVGEKLFDGYVYIENGKIVDVTQAEKTAKEEYDYTGKYVSAGFIDMHTHGAGGYAFMNSTPQDVASGCDYHLSFGTTTILPTISAGGIVLTFIIAVCVYRERLSRSQLAGYILGTVSVVLLNL
jgi:N-acetylglucosamine-6-phosphate deacetylase